jgi:hypothetical protein
MESNSGAGASAGATNDADKSLITFHCLSTKQKFQTANPEVVKTSHGRYFYVAPSPYAETSKKTGKPLGNMYRAVPKWKLEELGHA